MWLYFPEKFDTQASARETPASIWVSMQQSKEWAEALAASCTLKGKSLPSRSWLRESRKDFLTMLPCGLTSRPSTSQDGEVKWTDSLQECPANLSRKLAASRAMRMSDGSGRTSCGSCGSREHGSCSSRTSEESPPRRMGNLYRTSKGTWKPRVSFSKRMWSQRPLWAHLTSGTGSSSSPSTGRPWNTPRHNENLLSKEQVRRMAEGESAWKAANRGATTTTQGQAWPPKKWATTTTRDHKDGMNPSEKAPTNHLLGRQAPRWPQTNWTSATTTTTDATMKPENLRRVAKESLAVGNFRGVNLANHIGLWPTARSSPNENRTTKRSPSHGTSHGKILAGEAAEFPPRRWPTTTHQDAAGSRNLTAKRYSQKPFNPGKTMTDATDTWPDSQHSSLQERERLISVLGSLFSQPDPGLPLPSPRQLNPLFVEWLQGWPENWSDPDGTVSLGLWRSAMESCHSKLPWHSTGSYGVMNKPSKASKRRK